MYSTLSLMKIPGLIILSDIPLFLITFSYSGKYLLYLLVIKSVGGLFWIIKICKVAVEVFVCRITARHNCGVP